MHGFARLASRGWPLLAVAILLSGAALVSAAVSGSDERRPLESGPPQSRADGAPGRASSQRVARLKLSGHVDGLYPGASKRLSVEVRNSSPIAVVVTAIRTSVGDAGPGCPGANVTVPVKRLSDKVPARSSLAVRLRARMSGAAPDACQQGRFPLRFRASARAAP